VQRWTVLATAFEGRRPELLRALRRLGRFGGGGYRNVCVGDVEDVPACFDAVAELLAADPTMAGVLARMLPIDVNLTIDPEDPLAGLEPAVREVAPRLAGGAYYVRVERRGLRGTVHSSDVERTLGGVVWQALEAAGHAPRVDFADPAAVLCVETLGERAGLGVVTRAMRARWPFVRVR